MRLWNLAVLVGLSWTAVSPAFGQSPNVTPQTKNQGPIVIEGRAKQAIHGFVQRLTQSGPTDQIAHWKDQVCPVVLGIDPAQASFMEERISELGRKVRLTSGGSNCLSALAIVVTPDPDGFIAEMLRTYPMTLRADGSDRLKRFVQSTRPVRWISATDECGYGCAIGSRIRRETSPALSAMLVVVDSNQIGGITIGELSDYVALVALTNPPDRPKAHPNSVLKLFDDPRPPTTNISLSDYDRSFLSALYRTPVDRGANAQRVNIRRQMEHSLRNAPQTSGG